MNIRTLQKTFKYQNNEQISKWIEYCICCCPTIKWKGVHDNDHTHNNNYNYFNLLTIRELNLFFKILPIFNTGDSAADILVSVHFLYPKLGFLTDMEYYL